jgi:hypothetical protein
VCGGGKAASIKSVAAGRESHPEQAERQAENEGGQPAQFEVELVAAPARVRHVGEAARNCATEGFRDVIAYWGQAQLDRR